MFATTAVVVFIAASAVSAASVVPRAKYAVPTTYTAKWLEPYDDYHTRYLGLQCDKKHNTKLFDECCHPMLKWEKIESARPKYCVPGAFTPASVIATTVKATATATPTKTIVKPNTLIAIVSTSSSAAPAASTTPVVDDDEEDCDEDDEEDDDEEDCDEEEDDDDEDECVEGEADCFCEEIDIPVSSSAKPTSTKIASTTVPTSTKSVVFITSTVTAASSAVTVASSSKAAITVIPSGSFTFSSSSRMTTVRVSSTQTAASSSKVEVESSSKAPEAPKTTATSASTPKASPTPVADLTHQTEGTYTGGFATYYFQGGVAGACGEKKQDGDLIAAIDFRRYGKLDAKSLLCGARLTVTNTKNGKSVNVIVKDACPTCENANSVDLSEAAFLAIATRDEGMVPIKVSFAGRE